MFVLDDIDCKILSLLKCDSKISYKEIGEKIHMTGQAVGMRIKKMEEEGIIKAYTIEIDNAGKPELSTAFITIIMKSQRHAPFVELIENTPSIVEAYRVSGDGCYLLKVEYDTIENLNLLLDDILVHANYRLNISINRIK